MLLPILVVFLVVLIAYVSTGNRRSRGVSVLCENSRGGELRKMRNNEVIAVLNAVIIDPTGLERVDVNRVVSVGVDGVRAHPVDRSSLSRMRTSIANIRDFLRINRCMEPELEDLEARLNAMMTAPEIASAELHDVLSEYIRVLIRQLKTCPCTQGRLNLQLLQRIASESHSVARANKSSYVPQADLNDPSLTNEDIWGKVRRLPHVSDPYANKRHAFMDTSEDSVMDKYNMIRSHGGMWDTHKFDRPLTQADLRPEITSITD
jgi:hypothetical protein